MSDQITVQVSAPGATNAQKELNAAADAAARLALQESIISEATKKFSERVVVANVATQKFAVVMSNSGIRFQAVSAEMSRARREAEKLAAAMDKTNGGGHGGGHGGSNNQALYMASRAFPGHEMQILNGAKLLGGVAASAAGPLAALAAIAVTVYAQWEIAAERAKDHNKIAMDTIRIDQELHLAKRNAKWELEANAANTATGQRKSKRFIMNGDYEGARVIDLLEQAGTGGEGLNSMSEIIKNKRRFGKRSARDVFYEAQDVAGKTGMELNDVLSNMAQGQGMYSRERTIRELIGRGNNLQNNQNYRAWSTGDPKTALLDTVEESVRKKNRFNSEQSSDATVVGAGLKREYENLTNPMKEIISEHNRKIDEQIELQKQIIVRQVAGFEAIHEWFASFDRTGVLLGGKTQAATREVNTLRHGKRP